MTPTSTSEVTDHISLMEHIASELSRLKAESGAVPEWLRAAYEAAEYAP